MQVWGAWVISPPHRGYQIAKDSIGVFFNYKQIGDFKDRKSALKLVESLIKSAPKEAGLQEFMDVMIKAL